MIRIVHVIKSIDKDTGGPARSLTHLIDTLISQSRGCFDVFCLKSINPIIEKFQKPQGTITFFQPSFLNYSRALKKKLEINEFDLIHGHGLWEYPIYIMAKIARRRGIPYIISPRGMLTPWALNHHKFKKKIALFLFQFQDLKRASCIHATAPMEAENLRSIGLKNPIAIIPNGIQLDNFPSKENLEIPSKRKVLFLSRIHAKKGIEILVEAWSQLDRELTQDWKLEIVGNGEASYVDKIKQLVDKKGLNEQIQILPPKYGPDKIIAYQCASLFVLPSYSENFGIVVAESLACGTPVITTNTTPWEDLATYKCGWWIGLTVESLRMALEESMALSNHELHQMGRYGRKLVEEKYDIRSCGQQMSLLYEWVLKGGTVPKFVKLE